MLTLVPTATVNSKLKYIYRTMYEGTGVLDEASSTALVKVREKIKLSL